MTDTKAEIFRVDDTSIKVTCQFNPKDFAITKKVKWVYPTADGKNAPEPEFAGGEAQDLTVELLFDSTSDGTDVRGKYSALMTMAEIDTAKANTQTKKGEPPECKFQWGSFLSFTGVITTIGQNFTLFKADGTPLRAKVKVTFSEVVTTAGAQNPTTRTESRKAWVVSEGETLSWIAYKEYGNPAHWRHIAETNNLDDPMDLKPGQVIKLSPLP